MFRLMVFPQIKTQLKDRDKAIESYNNKSRRVKEIENEMKALNDQIDKLRKSAAKVVSQKDSVEKIVALKSKISSLKEIKRAQFLNVIESVFSGTKRAVIDNSDYKSEFEMKMALNKHFTERNLYFEKNPKRAGKKIWEKEIFDLNKFESGLHKHI